MYNILLFYCLFLMIYLPEDNISVFVKNGILNVKENERIVFSSKTDFWKLKDNTIIEVLSINNELIIRRFDLNKRKYYENIKNLQLDEENLEPCSTMVYDIDLDNNKLYIPLEKRDSIYLYLVEFDKESKFKKIFSLDNELLNLSVTENFISCMDFWGNFYSYQRKLNGTYSSLLKNKKKDDLLRDVKYINDSVLVLSFDKYSTIYDLVSGKEKIIDYSIKIESKSNSIFNDNILFPVEITQMANIGLAKIRFYIFDILSQSVSNRYIEFEQASKHETLSLIYYSIDRNGVLHVYLSEYANNEVKVNKYSKIKYYRYDLNNLSLISSEIILDENLIFTVY